MNTHPSRRPGGIATEFSKAERHNISLLAAGRTVVYKNILKCLTQCFGSCFNCDYLYRVVEQSL